ncbi:hypothetical protein CB1_000139013 [Camelus ferus]|nr:hypothetical protein CB1_000139013 [Camelus ferus]
MYEMSESLCQLTGGLWYICAQLPAQDMWGDVDISSICGDESEEESVAAGVPVTEPARPTATCWSFRERSGRGRVTVSAELFTVMLHVYARVIVDLPQRHSECEVDTCPLQQQQAAHLNQELLSPCAPGAAHQAGEVLGGRRAARPAVGAGVPMGETKAYQVLKLSTLQDGARQTEDRLQKAEASVPPLPASVAFLSLGRAWLSANSSSPVDVCFTSSRGAVAPPPQPRSLSTFVLITAFWGESDDSNSEIEAALRPRNRNTPTDDSDDFYDLPSPLPPGRSQPLAYGPTRCAYAPFSLTANWRKHIKGDGGTTSPKSKQIRTVLLENLPRVTDTELIPRKEASAFSSQDFKSNRFG